MPNPVVPQQVLAKPAEQVTEEQLYQMAFNLSDKNLGSFDICLDAVRRTNGDETKAV